MDDLSLMIAARNGDKTAFGQLVERYWQMSLNLARRLLGDDGLAHDAAQEAMLRAWLSLDGLRDVYRFQSWLYGIVLNVCREQIRLGGDSLTSLEALSGGIAHDDPPLTSPDPSPEAEFEARELHLLILRAVEALSPGNRAAVLLFYYQELPLREAAAALGISQTAMKGRLHKARQQLRDLLRPVFDSPVQGERKIMIPVKVIDVVRTPRSVEGVEQPVQHYRVVLYDGQRILVIWIGPAEGMAIAVGVQKFATMRPWTQSFMANLLKASGATLEKVEIHALRDDVFYATVSLNANGQTSAIDARPSDAIALAVHMDAPIYVAESVMEQIGHPVPEQYTGIAPQSSGIAEITAEIGEGEAKMRQRAEGQTEESHAKEMEEIVRTAHEEIVARMFGAG